MNTANDSGEVITFMTLFQDLQNLIGSDPNVLEERLQKLMALSGFMEERVQERGSLSRSNQLFKFSNDPSSLDKRLSDDEPFMKICNDLWSAGETLIRSQRTRRGYFIAPVNPNFIKTWRDYQTRYQPIFRKIKYPEDTENPESFTNTLRLNHLWEIAHANAQEDAYGFDEAIELVSKNESELDTYFPGYAFDLFSSGVSAWYELVKKIGFDIEGVFRRMRLVPFVLVPRHVSQHHSDAEKLSLYTNLEQAQAAFIFGVPFAALALMRSVLEITLNTHYQSTGADLNEQINKCENLPKGCSKQALHRIRMLANNILHVEKDIASLPDDFEKQIFRLLNALRALIEGAPATRR